MFQQQEMVYVQQRPENPPLIPYTQIPLLTSHFWVLNNLPAELIGNGMFYEMPCQPYPQQQSYNQGYYNCSGFENFDYKAQPQAWGPPPCTGPSATLYNESNWNYSDPNPSDGSDQGY